jgi:hypothetical protein
VNVFAESANFLKNVPHEVVVSGAQDQLGKEVGTGLFHVFCAAPCELLFAR